MPVDALRLSLTEELVFDGSNFTLKVVFPEKQLQQACQLRDVHYIGVGGPGS